MTKLILVRHGHSKANEEKIFAGHVDSPLTEKGQKQAEITAKYVAENYDVDVIYTSDLIRAKNTAHKIAELIKKEVNLTEQLREINGGEWEKKPYDLLIEKYPQEYLIWKNDIGKAVCTGGESIKELYERVNNEIDRIVQKNPNKTIVIVTHATPIRVFTARVLSIPVEDTIKVEWVPNASVSVFNVENGKINVEILGENSFHGKLASVLPKNV